MRTRQRGRTPLGGFVERMLARPPSILWTPRSSSPRRQTASRKLSRFRLAEVSRPSQPQFWHQSVGKRGGCYTLSTQLDEPWKPKLDAVLLRKEKRSISGRTRGLGP